MKDLGVSPGPHGCCPGDAKLDGDCRKGRKTFLNDSCSEKHMGSSHLSEEPRCRQLQGIHDTFILKDEEE